MMITRTVRLVVAQLVTTLLLSASVVSCVSPPDYPDTPKIEFKSIKSVRSTTNGTTKDVVTITITFQDGTGDLGLDSIDIKSPPFTPFLEDGTTRNRYFNNYFVKVLRKGSDGIFRSLNYEPDYDGRFDHLAPSEKAAPIKGDLSYSLTLLYGLRFRKGDEIRFEVTIADRGLRESNTITTESIIIP